MAVTIIISVALAVGLFMVVPYFVSRLLAGVVTSQFLLNFLEGIVSCLLYTSDAADEEDSVDLGGGRLIKKKKDHGTHATPRQQEGIRWRKK